ncbi:MAG TPA: hypothetical protein PKC86_01030 [Candidatus Saccharibacteria bacterium]|nr:hypothetical protein [Candidatus Saccharibacteria bacterium]
MKLYRFSPIKSVDECNEALEYLDTQLKKLTNEVIGESLPVNSLKIFAHYGDEHAFLLQWIDSIGKNEESSSTSYYVQTQQPININGDLISTIGIRTPDPYRSHVGCGDLSVEDYDNFKDEFLNKSPFIREIQHPSYEMLELFHPDFDVLGYVVKV